MAGNAAANGWSNTTFELRALDEGNELQYKTFSDNASLTVYYNFAPFTPTNLAISHQVSCTSTTYTSDLEPTLYANAADNNPSPLNLNLWFEAWTADGSTRLSWNTSGVQIASGSRGQWTTNMGGGFSGQFEYRVQDSNILVSGDRATARYSSWSGWFPFTDLPTAPTAAPSVSSYDYPADQWGQATGAPGVFDIGTNGASNIAGFAYSIDGGSASEPVPATTDCGYLADGGLGASTTANGITTGELQLVSGSSAQIRVPSAIASGRHTLYVRSFDDAHNASPESTYVFYVAPNYQMTSQPATIVAGDTLAATATGTNASLVGTQANCCGVTWHDGTQLFFNNTASGSTFTVALTVPDSGTWQLGANMTTAPDFAQLRVDLDGSTNLGDTAGSAFDAYTPIVSLKYLDLGTQSLTAGTHTLTFTATGKNAAASAYRAGIDYVELNPTNRYQATSLTHSTPTAGSITTQTWGVPLWSDNQQLILGNTTAGASYTVAFTAPVESDYALGMHMTEASDYGTVRFDLDPSGANINLHNTATTPIDAYSASVTAKYVFLGGVHLTPGSHILKITVVGTNSASVNNRYNQGFDFLMAAPVTGATETSFTAAMNNLGIATDGTATTASFDQSPAGSERNLSSNALVAAGLNPGTGTAAGNTFSLNGATFTMPQLKTDGSGNVTADNVVADGQTIPLPAVKATGVALLVTSTCGGSPSGNVTLNYAGGGQPSQPELAAVPDWLSSSPTATVTLDHDDAGSTADSATGPDLFEITVPANPNFALSSITLPLLTASFLPGTCPQALHVLALGERTVAAPPNGVWVGAYAAPMDTAIRPAGGSMTDLTLREEITPSVTGGGSARIHLSNAFSPAAVTFDAATIAAQSTNQATVAAPVALKFGGQTSVTISAGGDAYSDAVALPSLTGGTGRLTVSLHIPAADTVTLASIHDTTTTTTNYVSGNQTTNSDGTVFTPANSLTGLYYLAGIDVNDTTTTDGTVAILGDQTATAAPAWTTNTWGAALPSALSANGVTLPGGIADTSTGGTAPADWWRLGEGSGSTAYDSGGTHNVSLDGATWSTDDPNNGIGSNSLSFNGYTSDGYAATSGPVLNTAGSFTVSAWVKLASTANNAVVAAQDGTNESGFYLGYNTVNGGQWALYFMTADTVTPTFTPWIHATAATANTWTHLAGVYNASTHTAQLYVNGVLAGTATGITNWNATGAFTIGRDKYNGNPTDYFNGTISDVRVFNSALVATQISEVYNDNCGSTVTTADALAAFDRNTAAEPNLRDVILSLGTNDVLEGASVASIESNLTTLVNNLKGRYVNNLGNTPMQVFLTTIAPMGLPTGDSRETVRKTVNTWIMKNSGATLAVDTATAVADPGNVNQTASTYLTGGVPNPTYYTTIADTIAVGLAAIPPTPLVGKRG
jgi:hypothetical protein